MVNVDTAGANLKGDVQLEISAASAQLEDALESVLSWLIELREDPCVQEIGTVPSKLDSNIQAAFNTLNFNNMSDAAFEDAKRSYQQFSSLLGRSLQDVQRSRALLKGLLEIFSKNFHQLEELKKTTDAHLISLKLSHGLSSLPNDVLALVFEATLKPPFAKERDRLENDVTPFRVSAVCRRFRSIVLSLPNMWCNISSNLQQNALQLCLERSRNTGLQIWLESAGDLYNLTTEEREIRMKRLTNFVDSLVKVGERWVRLDVSGFKESTLATLKERLSTAPMFPNLTQVSMECVHAKSKAYAKIFKEIRKRTTEIHSLELDMRDLFYLKLPNTVRRLSVTIHKSNVLFNVPSFVAHLHSIPGPIGYLRLDFSDYEDEFDCPIIKMKDGKEGLKQTTFANVRNVDISVFARQSALSLLQSFHFPFIESLSLHFIEHPDDGAASYYSPSSAHDSDDSRYENGLRLYYHGENTKSQETDDTLDLIFGITEVWFTGVHQYPHLRSLTLNLDADSANDTVVPKDLFKRIARCCPNLENLTFETTLSTESLRLPPLRSVTLRYIYVCNSWIEEYGKWLNENGDMEAFNQLVLEGCVESGSYEARSWEKIRMEFKDKLIVICKC